MKENMKKLTSIAAMLLISITSNQMNCMDAFTDPYGLMDEATATLPINPEKEQSVLGSSDDQKKKTYEQALEELKDHWFLNKQSHHGVDGATYEDIERLNKKDLGDAIIALRKEYGIKEVTFDHDVKEPFKAHLIGKVQQANLKRNQEKCKYYIEEKKELYTD